MSSRGCPEGLLTRHGEGWGMHGPLRSTHNKKHRAGLSTRLSFFLSFSRVPPRALSPPSLPSFPPSFPRAFSLSSTCVSARIFSHFLRDFLRRIRRSAVKSFDPNAILRWKSEGWPFPLSSLLSPLPLPLAQSAPLLSPARGRALRRGFSRRRNRAESGLDSAVFRGGFGP